MIKTIRNFLKAFGYQFPVVYFTLFWLTIYNLYYWYNDPKDKNPENKDLDLLTD